MLAGIRICHIYPADPFTDIRSRTYQMQAEANDDRIIIDSNNSISQSVYLLVLQSCRKSPLSQLLALTCRPNSLCAIIVSKIWRSLTWSLRTSALLNIFDSRIFHFRVFMRIKTGGILRSMPCNFSSTPFIQSRLLRIAVGELQAWSWPVKGQIIRSCVWFTVTP